MGLLDRFKRIFGAKESSRIESHRIENRFKIDEKSIQIDAESNRIDEKSRQDVFKLGFLTGYVGKSLESIEDSLKRLESLTPSKDWLESKFQDFISKLMDEIRSVKESVDTHESNQEKRFNILNESLNRLESLASKAPSPLKEEILEEVETLKQNLPLTPRMEKLLSIVEEHGEISYKQLAEKMGISTDSLRGEQTLE